ANAPRRCTVISRTMKRFGPTCSPIRIPPTSRQPAFRSAASSNSCCSGGRISVSTLLSFVHPQQRFHDGMPVFATPGVLAALPALALHGDRARIERRLEDPLAAHAQQVHRIGKLA